MKMSREEYLYEICMVFFAMYLLLFRIAPKVSTLPGEEIQHSLGSFYAHVILIS